jgi:SAM-dependent methyltransferase
MTSAPLQDLLACPACREGELRGSGLERGDGEIECLRCDARYEAREGIPVLLPPGAAAAGEHDEIDHLCAHKRSQAEYFDRRVAEEFEIERPRGAPRAYGWTLEEKFRRSVAFLPSLRGLAVVDACCGSGMEAELLARIGARVLAVDISFGCAARAQERARRRGVDYTVVVGDVERLPVRKGAVDVAYVHDGLHHLREPLAGVRELARVAKLAVSINEPADALATRIAVRFGLALREEEAGNPVMRLRPDDVRSELERAGFRVRVRRYALYYRHQPGQVMRMLSRPGMFELYRATVRLGNAFAGRFGNKLQVTGIRGPA